MSVRKHRLAAGLLVVAAACLFVASAASGRSDGSARVADTSPGKLGKQDRALLALARANGDATVTLLLAAKDGQNADAASALQAAGATVQYRDDDVSYLRVEIATDQAEATVNGIDSIQSADVDEIVPLPSPSPDASQPAQPQPAPGAGTPNDNPYMPVGETGSSAFRAAHPTWDGRGITIGIVDTGVDLHHPSLQTTSTGERKVVDWVAGTDPATDNDPSWLESTTDVVAKDGKFTVGTTTYTAPTQRGHYFWSLFNERDARFVGGTSEYGGDVNRDGNPAGSSGLFGVIRDGDRVWVDTNQNLSFADETGMVPYAKQHHVGEFGTDNPATAVREVVPFVVQVAHKDVGTPAVRKTFVNIGIVAGFHGSHVSGILAGNSLFGGAMSGQAPGAKLLSVRACLFNTGCTNHALTEGMIWIVRNGADIVNMSIGGLPALNDGNNARCDVYNRLINKKGVQIVLSNGNSGPGLNTAGDPAVCSDAVAVGAYLSKASMRSNYGADTPFDDNLNYFSSQGPAEDGNFDPDVIAPGSAVSTAPEWQAGGPVAGTYALPPGYVMANGTSMAAPQTAGAGALLLSAAKASGLKVTPAQLRKALTSTARYLDPARFAAAAQGNGLINIPAAWDVLKTKPEVLDITATVPVNTLLSGFLATPGVGRGIYDREGVTPGTAYTRTYTITRSNGGSNPRTFNLSWVGNDGTFSSPSSITLPKGVPTSLTVNINPAVGLHSAILNFDDPASPGIEFQTMNTVVAPFVFNAGNNFSQSATGSVGRGQQLHYFFRVPTGTPAFRVDLTTSASTTPGTGQIRFLRWHPYGVGVDDNAVSNCYIPAQTTCSTGAANSRTVTNPQPGVWEVTVDARRTSDADFTPFTLSGTLIGATVSPNPDTIPTATIGTPVARSYTLTNIFGAFTGRAVGTALGSARVATPTIAHLAQQQFQTVIPAGTTQFRATIGSPSDPAADLDLFVFRCNPTCVQVGSNADGDSEESVTLNNPVAATYVVLVDGFNVPAGTTTYNYIDVFTKTPAFGSVSVTDANALRAAGSSWTVPGTVTAAEAPSAGRVLAGTVEVRTDTNLLVGTGQVFVQNVTP
jgi:subtilisin family serine protease